MYTWLLLYHCTLHSLPRWDLVLNQASLRKINFMHRRYTTEEEILEDFGNIQRFMDMISGRMNSYTMTKIYQVLSVHCTFHRNDSHEEGESLV